MALNGLFCADVLLRTYSLSLPRIGNPPRQPDEPAPNEGPSLQCRVKRSVVGTSEGNQKKVTNFEDMSFD